MAGKASSGMAAIRLRAWSLCDASNTARAAPSLNVRPRQISATRSQTQRPGRRRPRRRRASVAPGARCPSPPRWRRGPAATGREGRCLRGDRRAGLHGLDGGVGRRGRPQARRARCHAPGPSARRRRSTGAGRVPFRIEPPGRSHREGAVAPGIAAQPRRQRARERMRRMGGGVVRHAAPLLRGASNVYGHRIARDGDRHGAA
jgi:hypothetical protein